MFYLIHTILLFGVSGSEILLILLFVLILFGPKKIPEIARAIGKGINEMRKVQRDINTEINRYTSEVEKPLRQMENDLDPRMPPGINTDNHPDLPYDIHDNRENSSDKDGDNSKGTHKPVGSNDNELPNSDNNDRPHSKNLNHDQPANP